MKKVGMIVVSLLLVFSVNVQASRCPKFTDTGFCWPIGKSDQEFDQACGKWLGRDAVHGGCYFNGLYHIGVDMMTNGNFYAISNGKVFYKHCDDSSWGSGNCALFIRHQASDGTVFTGLYGHVRTSLNVGDEVQLGQVIGTAGPYGNGEHLHFGIRLGDSVMPSPWGRLSNSRWPDTNGFVDPIAFIKNHKPKNPTSFRFTPQKVINRCKAKLEGNLAKHGLQLKEWQNLRVITHKKVFDPQTQGNLYDFIVSGIMIFKNEGAPSVTILCRSLGGEKGILAAYDENTAVFINTKIQDHKAFKANKEDLVKEADDETFVPTARDILSQALEQTKDLPL